MSRVLGVSSGSSLANLHGGSILENILEVGKTCRPKTWRSVLFIYLVQLYNFLTCHKQNYFLIA